ncbi:hypothetical protein [Tropicimonas marinistellae]|uniref:hypothetical protein n=1 Tax=Tropicimonas marinistellae TaxID=1739787 RepID=UPI00122DE2CD|nr:hypothetical protein [Tropicimonas marinistellae]
MSREWVCMGFQGAEGAILFPGEVFLDTVLSELRSTLRDVQPVLLQRLASGATVFVCLFIVDKVGGWICTVLALGFVEDRDVGGDILVLDKPAEHVGGAAGCICCQHDQVQVETLLGSRQHVTHGADFGLPGRNGGRHIDNDRVVWIDQIVGDESEEGPVTVGSGNPRTQTMWKFPVEIVRCEAVWPVSP